MPAEYGLPAAKVQERLRALVERNASASARRTRKFNAADLSPDERAKYGFAEDFQPKRARR